MTQPGAGARAKRFKRNSFSRTVTLIKTNDEHTSFSDMRNIKTKSVIEFSSCMTQDNVRDKIQETFPYLENKRYVNHSGHYTKSYLANENEKKTSI